MGENEDKNLLILVRPTKHKSVRFLVNLGKILVIFKNFCGKTRKRGQGKGDANLFLPFPCKRGR